MLKRYSFRSSLQSVASAGTFAEEVISTIRTAQAFGTQTILANVYNKPIDDARVAGIKGAIWRGGSGGVFLFIVYSGYALGELHPWLLGPTSYSYH